MRETVERSQSVRSGNPAFSFPAVYIKLPCLFLSSPLLLSSVQAVSSCTLYLVHGSVRHRDYAGRLLVVVVRVGAALVLDRDGVPLSV